MNLQPRPFLVISQCPLIVDIVDNVVGEKWWIGKGKWQKLNDGKNNAKLYFEIPFFKPNGKAIVNVNLIKVFFHGYI